MFTNVRKVSNKQLYFFLFLFVTGCYFVAVLISQGREREHAC